MVEFEMIKSLLRQGERDVERLISWLGTTDFTTAPASTRFHGNYEGGLMDHSFHVYQRLVQLASSGIFPQAAPDAQSLAITAICHDLCKVNFYQKSTKAVKENGIWVEKPIFVIDEKMPLGHGEKSVIILSRLVKLTAAEMLAIRWHMGAFLVSQGSWEVENAWMKREPNEFPLAVALHMADAIASRFDDAMDGTEPSQYAIGKGTATAPEPMPADVVEWSRENCFGFIDACGDGSLDPCSLAFNTLRSLIGEASENNVRNGSDPASDRGFGACPGGLKKYVCYMTYYLRALNDLLGVQLSERNILVCGTLAGLGRAAKWQPQIRHRKAQDGSWEDYTVYLPEDKDFGAPFDGPIGQRGALWANALMDGKADNEELIALMYIEGAHGTLDKGTVGKVFDEHPMAFLTHLAHLASAFGSNY